MTPTLVDIYLGAVLPDLTTFLSIVEQAPGVVAIKAGPTPGPYRVNVTAAPLTVPQQYTFGGTEPVGTYFAYAALIVAGGDPLLAANQLSLDIQPFEFAP